MTIYTENFISNIIDKYRNDLPKEYRKYEYSNKCIEDQFKEALQNLEYDIIIKCLDDLFNEALDDGQYNWKV